MLESISGVELRGATVLQAVSVPRFRVRKRKCRTLPVVSWKMARWNVAVLLIGGTRSKHVAGD